MTPTRAAGLVTLIVCSSFSAELFAGEVTAWGLTGRVDITSTTQGGWHFSGAAGEGYVELFERLNVATGTGAWNLALRLDTATFGANDNPAIRSRYTLEKISLGWSGRDVEVIAGDAYISFGRGLGLSLRKVDELGVDTTLRGLKVLVHKGVFNGTLAFGYPNINNVDESSGKNVDDTHDLVGGAQAQVLLFDRLNLGAQGTIVAFRDPLGFVPHEEYRDRYYQFGPSIDAPGLTENLDLYLEGIYQLRDTMPASEPDSGMGAYGAATIYAGPATILFEGKAYGKLEPIKPKLDQPEFASISYHNPPTVERVLQTIENPQKEIAGGRVRFDWTFSPEFLAYVNYGYFRDFLGYSDPLQPGITKDGIIHDPYAGFELRWNEARSWALVSAGWRGVLLEETVVRGNVHAELDITQALGHGMSLNLHVIHDEKKKYESPILNIDYREGTVLLGYRWPPHLSLNFGYDYTTEPVQPKRHYFSGTVQWDITESSSLRLFVGSQRGGLKCVSGVCRTFAPFEGAKLIATLRY